jgi:DNA-binding CsgD family transcriptional regulator
MYPQSNEWKSPTFAAEAEVTQAVGFGDRATRLVVSDRTVDHHVATILRKLDVRTRGEASAEAVRLGLASGGA